jgi:parallel beta-helix repeat protein
MKRTFVLAIFLAFILYPSTFVLAQGPLTPPGAPAPTMKTLDQVEPRIAINATNTPGDTDSLFKITQPGSYYLTGNITGEASKHGIEIVASGVTVDLNGFDLVGVPGSLDGVSVTTFTFTNLAVLNGSVRNWGDEGVDFGSTSNSNGRVADLRASGNAGNGISTGNVTTVTNCTSYQNTGNGIVTGNSCTITNCSAVNNGGSGINATSGSLVSGCIARFNTLDGILCSAACIIRGNSCSLNGNGAGSGAGIHATGFDNRIEGNNCSEADRGIDVDAAGNIIIKNTCATNTIDWTIAANNVFGPIIDRRAPASAAVSGFTAASTLGSTDPWANFSY